MLYRIENSKYKKNKIEKYIMAYCMYWSLEKDIEG